MTQISREAFMTECTNGNLETNRHWVYARILKSPVKIHDIVKDINMPIQTVSGRITELLDKGLINQDMDGNFYAATVSDMDELKNRRQWEKFKKWKALGEKMGYFGLMEHV